MMSVNSGRVRPATQLPISPLDLVKAGISDERNARGCSRTIVSVYLVICFFAYLSYQRHRVHISQNIDIMNVKKMWN
jgi:hypothetical protein